MPVLDKSFLLTGSLRVCTTILLLAGTIGHSTDKPQSLTQTSETGSRHPQAPAELEQFEFLVGTHECVDILTSATGESTHLNSRWNARYILNGFGIQDDYSNDQFSATNIRIYDSTRDLWVVTYFREPGAKSGVWEGHRETSDIVLHRYFEYDDEAVESRLRFKNISASGFEWSSSYISGTRELVSWTSSCRRAGG